MWKKPKHEFHIPGFNLGHCQDVIAANAGCYHGHHTMPSQPSQDAIPVMAMRTLRPSPKSPVSKQLRMPGIARMGRDQYAMFNQYGHRLLDIGNWPICPWQAIWISDIHISRHELVGSYGSPISDIQIRINEKQFQQINQ
jgi:hypothetical protein